MKKLVFVMLAFIFNVHISAMQPVASQDHACIFLNKLKDTYGSKRVLIDNHEELKNFLSSRTYVANVLKAKLSAENDILGSDTFETEKKLLNNDLSLGEINRFQDYYTCLFTYFISHFMQSHFSKFGKTIDFTTFKFVPPLSDDKNSFIGEVLRVSSDFANVLLAQLKADRRTFLATVHLSRSNFQNNHL